MNENSVVHHGGYDYFIEYSPIPKIWFVICKKDNDVIYGTPNKRNAIDFMRKIAAGKVFLIEK